MKNKTILPYKKELVTRAKYLRNNSTFSERVLWKYLKQKQLKGYDFDRQKSIDKYIVDFFCNGLMLAIEIDGESHNEKLIQDKHRQNRLEHLGIKFLRFNGFQVINNTKGVLQIITDWVEEYEKTHP